MIGIRKIIAILCSLLMPVLLITAMYAPYAYADTSIKPDLSSKITIANSSNVIIKEMTNTSQVIQVGNILITVNSDSGHTHATLELKNLNTSQSFVYSFIVTRLNGKYKTDIYYNGTLFNTSMTNVDPLQPGVLSEVYNNSKSNAAGNALVQSQGTYTWDGIIFTNNGNYPHPDYASNYISPSDNTYLVGYQLIHRHLDSTSTQFLAAASVLDVAGVCLALLWVIPFEVAGIPIGELALGDIGVTTDILHASLEGIWDGFHNSIFDENGASWFWWSTEDPRQFPGLYGSVLYPFTYLRIGSSTRWDLSNIGDPGAPSSVPQSFTVTLHPGWNYISVPYTVINRQKVITGFFPSSIQSRITDVWAYNPAHAPVWNYYSLSRSTSDTFTPITKILPYLGYIVYYDGTSDYSYQVSGLTPAFNQIPYNSLYQGWNLIGYPSTTYNYPINLYGSSLDTWGYDNGFWSYFSGQRFSNNGGYSPNYPHLQSLQPGHAYWVNTYDYILPGQNEDYNNVQNPPQPFTTNGRLPPNPSQQAPYFSKVGSVQQSGVNSYYIDIPGGVQYLYAVLYWQTPANNLDISLYDPNGNLVDISNMVDTSVEQVEVRSPVSGKWRLEVKGVTVSGSVPYSILSNYALNEQSARTGGPDYFGYTFKDSNAQGGPAYDWIDITSIGTMILPSSDDYYVNGIPVGFFFNYYGTDYSQVSITNNGIVLASGGTSQWTNQPIGSSTPHNFIAPYWDDLVTWGSAGAVYYKTIGAAPNRMFVVEWYDNQHYYSSPSGITFEAILYEGTNDIKFQYKDVNFDSGDSYGASATVGIESFDGRGLQYSYNEPVINNGQAILFKFPAFGGTNMYLSKSGPASMDHGNTATYTLYYNNFGSVPASNVVLQDTLPSGVEFVSASDGGTYEPSNGKVTWSIGSVPVFPAGRGYRTVTVRVPASIPVGTLVTNMASISTSTIETRYDDNCAIVSAKLTGSGLPPNVGVSPTNGNTGSGPSVYWGNPVTFTYYNPSATDVGIKIHINDGGADITGPMQQTSSGTWSYTTTFYPRHGAATITYTVAGQPAVTFSIYIDPSGYIYDVATGERISSATVWLQRPDGQGGWENVPTYLNPPVSQPDVNPQVTGDDGQYQWDVVEGSYRVHVEAADYYPADSIVVNVPPPVTDLHVGLTRMPDFTPPASVTNLHNTTYTSSHINWTWSNPADHDLAGAMVYLNGVFQTNVTSGAAWYNATDLIPDTEYTVGIRTFDRSGNINQTIVTHTARTAPLDIEPPLTTLVLSGTTGNNGWYVSDVVVNLTATDGADGSGVNITEYGFDGVSWNQYIEPLTIATEGTTTVFYRSLDNAGNFEPASNTTIKIDKTMPAIVINTPADGGVYLLNSSLVANWDVVDSLSGIASVNGIAAGERVDTSTVGAKTFTISAVDNAGNNATNTSSYAVVYDFQGFMPPIKVNNSSIFKHGSTIPVKFRIADADGRYVSTAVANLTYQKISGDILGSIEEPVSTSASDTGNMFRYNTEDYLYIYNLNTDDMSTGTYQLNINLDDGMVKSVWISIK